MSFQAAAIARWSVQRRRRQHKRQRSMQRRRNVSKRCAAHDIETITVLGEIVLFQRRDGKAGVAAAVATVMMQKRGAGIWPQSTHAKHTRNSYGAMLQHADQAPRRTRRALPNRSCNTEKNHKRKARIHHATHRSVLFGVLHNPRQRGRERTAGLLSACGRRCRRLRQRRM